MAKVLLLGGTGAIGSYLADSFAKSGVHVDVTTRGYRVCDHPRIAFIRGDAQDVRFLREVLSNGYDVVVDFMTRATANFGSCVNDLLTSAGCYVFLSSYRVFGDSPTIREDSPRLLDCCKDQAYLGTDDYALRKARCEDILRASSKKNWIIVRPSITYSNNRFQLATLEAHEWLWRAMNKLPVALPNEVLNKRCTLTWAGDVANMIRILTLSPELYGEDYNVVSSSSKLWSDILRAYQEVIPFEVRQVSLEEYEKKACWHPDGLEYAPQLRYDRLFNRVMDNEKILMATGIRQDDLADVCTMVKKELEVFLEKPGELAVSPRFQAMMDALTGSCCLKKMVNGEQAVSEKAKMVFRYMKNRLSSNAL